MDKAVAGYERWVVDFAERPAKLFDLAKDHSRVVRAYSLINT